MAIQNNSDVVKMSSIRQSGGRGNDTFRILYDPESGEVTVEGAEGFSTLKKENIKNITLPGYEGMDEVIFGPKFREYFDVGTPGFSASTDNHFSVMTVRHKTNPNISFDVRTDNVESITVGDETYTLTDYLEKCIADFQKHIEEQARKSQLRFSQ